MISIRCCCCYSPPCREVCMDYEVALFQLKTLTTPYLGSAANRYTFKLGLLPDLFILPFLDLPSPPLFPTASPSMAVHCQSLIVFNFLPTSSPGAKRRPPGHFTPPLPVSLCRSSLRLVMHACVCRRFPCCCVHPFASLGMHSGPCQPLGGSPIAGPSAPLCTSLSLPWRT